MASSKLSHSKLTEEQGQILVSLARQTLATHFRRPPSEGKGAELESRLQGAEFQASCGVFVTLKIGEQLRGCIGCLTGRGPLAAGVRDNAIHAALHDPRFAPLSDEELDRVVIEVSVLTPPQSLDYEDGEDLLRKLRPGVDGVTIRKHMASATFLPQVWDQLPKKEDFLTHLCRKAGLPDNGWRKDGLEVETYQVQFFEEKNPETGK